MMNLYLIVDIEKIKIYLRTFNYSRAREQYAILNEKGYRNLILCALPIVETDLESDYTFWGNHPV